MESLFEQVLILFSVPVYFVLIGVEIILNNYQQRRSYSLKDSVMNLYLMLLNSAIDLFFRSVYLVILDYFYRHHWMSLTNVVTYWLMLLLLEDLLYYWLHRIDHEIRFFWAVHVTHHSSGHMNLTVGFRSSVFQPLYRFIYFIPLALLGFKPLDIIFIYSATQIWGIFIHTEMIQKMGWLEYILVTPSHHRVHHASNPKYLDRNMGMFLIIWDKLFGTFQPELPDSEYQPKKYGLTKSLEKENPTTVVFHEWNQILEDLQQKNLSLREKWRYVFGPPGWSHDGTRLTSDDLRQIESGAIITRHSDSSIAPSS